MARNEEKHYGKLNRIHLQKEWEEWEKNHPKRPHLNSLHTAEDIRQWLPSIKTELDFFLKQSEVICYPESKINEFKEEIEKLEKIYKSFVRKIKELQREVKGQHPVPWTPRAYESSRIPQDIHTGTDDEKTSNEEEFQRIEAPVLEKTGYQGSEQTPVIWNVNPDAEDQPLDTVLMKVGDNPVEDNNTSVNEEEQLQRSYELLADKIKHNVAETKGKLMSTFGLSLESDSYENVDYSHVSKKLKLALERSPYPSKINESYSSDKNLKVTDSDIGTSKIHKVSGNLLGLIYSSSSSEDET